MSDHSEYRQATAKVLDTGDDVGDLASGLYKATGESAALVSSSELYKNKPTHYKVICISMYTEDLQRLDQMVDTLKTRGLTKANRSALIRHALGALDLDSVPKGL